MIRIGRSVSEFAQNTSTERHQGLGTCLRTISRVQKHVIRDSGPFAVAPPNDVISPAYPSARELGDRSDTRCIRGYPKVKAPPLIRILTQ